jgi:glyoxylase I family protein
MTVQRLHHVAYRCRDAKKTVEFYEKYLDLEFNAAIAENIVPSTGERSPHIHIFLKMDDNSSVAFFELPESDDMQADPNTPDWVQHLAMKVENMDTLLDYKQRLEAGGQDVLGPIDHSFCHSIYFHDPSGHRLELTADADLPDLITEMHSAARPILESWDEHREAVDVDPLHANARN